MSVPMLYAIRKGLRKLRPSRPVGDAYYGDKAATYNEARIKQGHYQSELDAVQTLLRRVPDRSSVLDMPFGTGRFVPLYLDKQMQVYGLDASADMIAAAKGALGGQFDRCTTTVGDATNLPYPDNNFDVVCCVRFLGSIIPFEAAKIAIAELARVTRQYAIIEISERTGWRWRRPKGYEKMGGKLYANEVVGLFETYGLSVVAKLGPLKKRRDRELYMYLFVKR